MKNIERIIVEMSNRGYRQSKSREAILTVLSRELKPMSVQDLLSLLKKQKMMFNKTTIYREVELLERLGYVKALALRNDTVLYEIVGSHHHHLMCTKCGDVRHIELKENLRAEEQRIAKKENFLIQEHILEFFGICGKCG